jgi:hypothetical protein
VGWLSRLRFKVIAGMAGREHQLPRGEIIGDTSSPLLARSIRVYAAREGGADMILEFPARTPITGETLPTGVLQMKDLLFRDIEIGNLASMIQIGMRRATTTPRLEAEVNVSLSAECQAAVRAHPNWHQLRMTLNGHYYDTGSSEWII